MRHWWVDTREFLIGGATVLLLVVSCALCMAVFFGLVFRLTRWVAGI